MTTPPPYVPGKTPRPVAEIEGGDEEAARLFDAGYFWEAHEVWERLWRAERDEVARSRLQGKILVAAACLKRVQGNERAFASLAARAVAKLRAAGEPLADEVERFAAGLAERPVVSRI